jgi:hypothetical protein
LVPVATPRAAPKPAPLFSTPFQKPFTPDSKDTPPLSAGSTQSPFISHPAKQYQAFKQHIPYSILFSRQVIFLDYNFFLASKGDTEALAALVAAYPKEQILAPLPDHLEGNFKLVSRLGQGSFGSVFFVKSLHTGQDFAIKKTRQPFIGYKDAYLVFIQNEENERSRNNFTFEP